MEDLDKAFTKISLENSQKDDTSKESTDQKLDKTELEALDESQIVSSSTTSETKPTTSLTATQKKLSSDTKISKSIATNDQKPSFESVAKSIQEGTCKNVIFMVGAGISTSVGIPDFRTKGSGLFDKLEKYKLPFKEAIFDISFFKKNPKPFFALSRELFPGNFQPSLCHFFMTLLDSKEHLLRCYTQNIDGLERVAGMPAEKLVEAHGTFHSSHCINRKCRREYSLDWMKKTVLKPEDEDNVPKCEKCDSVVKPDITFYGEMLPDRFYDLVESDFRKCDLLIILGTSLTVQPFASLAQMIRPEVKRLMINLTKPDDIDWDSKKNKTNVFVGMETDRGSEKLADLLGWKDDLKKLYHDYSDSETTVVDKKVDDDQVKV